MTSTTAVSSHSSVPAVTPPTIPRVRASVHAKAEANDDNNTLHRSHAVVSPEDEGQENDEPLNASFSDSRSLPEPDGSQSTQPRQQHAVVTPPDATANKNSNTWEIPRFGDFEKKRLALCQQRVRLERQLFEASRNHRPIASSASSQQLSLTEAPGHVDQREQQSLGSQNNDPAQNMLEQEYCADHLYDNTGTNELHVERFLVRFERGHAHWTGTVQEVEVNVHEDGSTISSLSSCEHATDRHRRNSSKKPSQRMLKPNGRGTMEYANGQSYEGNVVNGLRHGFGRNTWPDGQVYVGGWENNSRTGRGSHTWQDGKTVTGIWTSGHLNGLCFFTWPDGSTYDGDTHNGKKHGRGVHTWADGKIYKGQYEGGYEHGHGSLTEADGLCRYRGQFRYGQRHGHGTQIWRNKTYDGEWNFNAVCGTGKLTWKNGAIYQGQFSHGRYHGKGSFVDKTGRKYVGTWVQGQKEGSGRETWPQTGQSYFGSYLEGRRHGFGRLTAGDGSMYCGGWHRGKRSGRGIHLNQAGLTVHCGLWKNDKPVRTDMLHSLEPAETLDNNSPAACDEPSLPSPSRSSGSSSRDDMDLVLATGGQRWHGPKKGVPRYYQDAEFYYIDTTGSSRPPATRNE